VAKGVPFIWDRQIAGGWPRLDRGEGVKPAGVDGGHGGAMAGDGRSRPIKRFRARETKPKALERLGA